MDRAGISLGGRLENGRGFPSRGCVGGVPRGGWCARGRLQRPCRRASAPAIAGGTVHITRNVGAAFERWLFCELQLCIPWDTMGIMPEIRQTEQYAQWFDSLRDRQAKARINIRIRRLSLGNPGDARAVGQGVSELRIDYGPGYQVYFKRRGELVVILLAGGDKRTQERDIKLAIELARDLGDYHGKN